MKKNGNKNENENEISNEFDFYDSSMHNKMIFIILISSVWQNALITCGDANKHENP